MGAMNERDVRNKEFYLGFFSYGSFKKVIAFRYYCISQNRQGYTVETKYSKIFVAFFFFYSYYKFSERWRKALLIVVRDAD